ncbi:MAG: DUF5979 domain-containing protein, partial [Symbiobacteriaceae bacterium]|nr:DUF5979 domain-containing protein [Symbiobacteriaceae bacterium]
MSGKTKKLLPLLVLIAAVLCSTVNPVFAADPLLRMVLRYYDNIQITYAISYPAGYDRGEWEGPEDIPIGGIGTPGPGQFDIDSYLATQIYCVDPFATFHGNVPGLGGSNKWSIDAMADTITGYVSAAPWIMSGAMQKYGDAVGWIAANGYRGVYNYSGEHDQEGKDSIVRLTAMFPTVGTIDREIAVMATKVAIWKLLEPEAVQVVKTTLDNRPAMRTTFDALVKALVDEGLKQINPKDKMAPLPGEIATTSLNLEIDNSNAEYRVIDGSSFDYIGPLSLSGWLENSPSAGSPNLSKVFLTASGLNSAGVQFVAETTGQPGAVLPSDTLFGTIRSEQYIGGRSSGDAWVSDNFYLAIPKSRDNPANGDQLLIKAMAMAEGAQVVEGTPIVLAFAKDGVQDWNAIQAFVGGTSRITSVNLYAETDWSTGNTPLGELYISKKVENSTPDSVDHLFTFAVYYNSSTDFTSATRLNLKDYLVSGVISKDTTNNTFTLKNGGLALIEGLPIIVSGGNLNFTYNYWIEELSLPDRYDPPQFEVSMGLTAPGYTVNGNLAGPFRLDPDEDLELAFVTVTNTFMPATGNLMIYKNLAGSYEDWGVDNSTVYSIQVKDATNNNYLRFSGVSPTFTCIGNSGSSDRRTGDTLTFSAGQRITITGLWADVAYVVEEVEGANYEISYSGNNVILGEGQNNTVTITNTFEHGTGDLVINKRLAGNYPEWGVNQDTLFKVRVKDTTNDVYLLFSGTGPSYTCIGNSGSNNPSSGDLITLTAGQPVTITNLWANVTYEVEELSGANYAISYQGNGVMFEEGQNSTVTVTNTFSSGTGNLIIDKRLAGSFTDWGVDNATVFKVTIKDTTLDNYLLFKTVPEIDGSYRCIGNNVGGLSETYTGETTMELPVSGQQPLIISNLWLGAVYVAEEAASPHSKPSYTGNGAVYTPGQNSSITITNTYEHGTGAIIVKKDLAGSYGGWGVNNNTTFEVTIRDRTDNNTLLFKTTPEADGTFRCIGNDVNGLSEAYSGETTTKLTFSAGRPLAVSNLWANHVYEVIETAGSHLDVAYIGNGTAFQDGQNSVVTVVNTYDPTEPPGPDVPQIPHVPGRPPEQPNRPGEPEDPDEPIEPGIPGIPGHPGGFDPGEPGDPDEPGEPGKPNIPEVPETPDKPHIPEEPDTPK